jgi:hypothetical protein
LTNVDREDNFIMNNKYKLLVILPIFSIALASCSSSEENVTQEVAITEPTPSTGVVEKNDHLHPRGDGTVPTAQGVSIQLNSTTYKVGKNTISFVINRVGEPVASYVINHEKPLHFIVVDKKLGTFQHLHPVMGENFTWSLPIEFSNSGEYRVYADFTLEEGGNEIKYLLGSDIVVTGNNPIEFMLPEPDDEFIVDGLNVSVSGSVSATDHTTLMFTVTKYGNVVNFDPYLGSTGHLIAVREGDLAMAHMHNSDHSDGAHSASTSSMPGMLHFDAEFPSGAGKYRLFLEFMVAGELKLATFTTNVL